MKLLILDTETTDAENYQACEIGATLYQVSENIDETGAIASISTLIPVTNNSVQQINQITPHLTQAANNIYKQSIDLLAIMAFSSDYIIAFNAEFDSQVVKEILPDCIGLPSTWVCAMKDFDWGYPTKPNGNYKLTDLALWMGIGVSTVHRAADDVRLLVECFNRRKEVLPEMVEAAVVLAKSPVVELKAVVSYEHRSLAKNAGFSWDGDRRIWVKKVKQCKLDEFQKILEFDVEVINIG
ncbi:DNA polymerase III subunit epsilon [Nostoc sp. ATCC 43529]|nr:DNA polymerase III subunit epsilon [Nostoc sp. ATCC 43529]